jgi:hypothetical protein
MKVGDAENAIGGYFALELGGGRGIPWLDNAVGYQSARSALSAVLRATKPNAVWVPHYICGAVDDALRSASVTVRRYALSDALGVPIDLKVAATDTVICVDYFGICGAEVDRALDRFGSARVIVDASQSLFLSHRLGSIVIYSPRKFLGVPDGGLVLGAQQLAPLQAAIEGESIARSQHLLWRLAGYVEAGYGAFRAAEDSLSSCEPHAMSCLTHTLLRMADMDAVATKRVRNYERLAQLLDSEGFHVPSLPTDAIPLCCPVTCNNAASVRRELTSKRIFTPSYWPDAVLPEEDRAAHRLRDGTVYLPCDQRYGDAEMERIARCVIELKEAA